MPIKAITFDFWRTLFHDLTSDERQKLRLSAFMNATGVPEERAVQAFDATYREFARCHVEEQRTLRPEDAVRIVCEESGCTVDTAVGAELAEIFATVILKFPPIPIAGAVDAVRAASERFPVGLVCDSGISPGSSLKCLLEINGFLPYFEVLVFSDEVGVSKPQAPMFNTAAAALGVEPAELLHIGDLEGTDIIGAHGVGAKAALFAGDNARYLEDTTADYAFTDWNEFIALLPELG